MDGPNPGAGEHRNHEFGRHRHVDRNHFPRLHAKLRKTSGTLADLCMQLAIRNLPSLADWLADPHDCDLIATAGGNVLIETGSRCVGTATHKPLRIRWIPVEHLCVGRHPRQRLRAGMPKAIGVAGGLIVDTLVVFQRTNPGLL